MKGESSSFAYGTEAKSGLKLSLVIFIPENTEPFALIFIHRFAIEGEISATLPAYKYFVRPLSVIFFF